MGTSTPSGGSRNNTPLVPTWLEQDTPPSSAPVDSDPQSMEPNLPGSFKLPIPPVDASRFTAARTSFSRFSSSGGVDKSNLGRALSSYVRSSCGGPKNAAIRMGPAISAGGRLVSFMADASGRGLEAALRRFNLQGLAGKPIQEVFLALTDFICPDGGSADEGLVRDAFIEMVAELAEDGVSSFDTITEDQLRTIIERFMTHSVKDRILNDIGSRVIEMPATNDAVIKVEGILHDFVAGAVHDAVGSMNESLLQVKPDSIQKQILKIYEASFGLIESIAGALI